MNKEKATFAAGCFWGVESTFMKIPGVIETTVGYTGGKRPNPSYEQVCTGATGHAEAVEVIFDPTQVSFEKLLEVFWSSHNPTTYHQQGPDIGSQYRSAIFYHSPEQKIAAEKSKSEQDGSGKFKKPIVTEITEALPFYPAEEYHQKYNQKHGIESCHI